ncbi:MAG: hypothetical protein ACKVS8_12830 [Phycisphaerales bacterium]
MAFRPRPAALMLGMMAPLWVVAGPARVAFAQTITIDDSHTRASNNAIAFIPFGGGGGTGGAACGGLLMVAGVNGTTVLDALNLAAGPVAGACGNNTAIMTFMGGAADAATTQSGSVYGLSQSGNIARFGFGGGQNTGLNNPLGLAIIERGPLLAPGTPTEVYAIVAGTIEESPASQKALRVQDINTGSTGATAATPFRFSGLAYIGRIDGEQHFLAVRNVGTTHLYQFSLGPDLTAPVYREVGQWQITNFTTNGRDAVAFRNGRVWIANENRIGSAPFVPIGYTPCAADYNRDQILNPDDLGDFITDYYTDPHIPGPGGYAIACPENEPPFDAGYKAGYTPDASGQCNPPFPDNLGDYITDYFGSGC